MPNATPSEVIHKLHDEAAKGCGLNYELFAERFSLAIDNYLDSLQEPERSEFLKLATSMDYVSPEDRVDPEELGLCKHHFDPHCCPLGCGDL